MAKLAVKAKSPKVYVHQYLIFKTLNMHSIIKAHKNENWIRIWPGRIAQSVGHLTSKPGVQGSIPGLATYFRFSFRFFKKGSCQLLAKVCARSTG